MVDRHEFRQLPVRPFHNDHRYGGETELLGGRQAAVAVNQLEPLAVPFVLADEQGSKDALLADGGDEARVRIL